MPAKDRRTRYPATTPEGRENQLVSLAMDLAERQMRDGTASAQVITHYLKIGSIREQMERDRLIEENKLLRAKAESVSSSSQSEASAAEALRAFRGYAGQAEDEYYYE